ncbi:hypothetical protein [Streptomyces albireticuli]|uniref:hypothetical protein n=1 Tax=Streptomyces albireticuli TaxID=1940 RepID=UPI001B801F5B|nr:hypothetical protein [Streptomyces albireticuli]MCD9192791.1 hypothetical protein [Streptomyces albireticuli]
MRADQRRLREVAAAQGGIVLAAQAAGAGLRADGVARSLRRAGWSRILPGAWAEPGRVVDLPLRLRAWQLRHPELVASHSSAAAAHGIALLRPYGAELTAPGRGRRAAGAVVHGIPVAEEEVTAVAGVRVTTPVRTVCDLLRTLPLEEGVIAADSALARGAVDTGEVEASLAASSRRPGTRRARRALALTDAGCGSPAETKARLEMRGAGLRPESQAEVVTARGRTARLDFLFRAEGLGVEIEGFTWHGSRAAHQNDTMRFNDLAGCPELRRLLRFTRDDVFHRPRLTVRTIEAALAGLRAEPSRPPRTAGQDGAPLRPGTAEGGGR